MSEVRPALVDLVLTKCTPGVAAYEATILDLAARGFLGISGGPDGLRVTLAGPPAGVIPFHPPAARSEAVGSHGGDEKGSVAVLADYEQQVLGDARARLAGADGAPFAALAGACSLDVDATWNPFRDKLLAEGRRLGICRKNLWARPAGIVLLLLISIAAAILVALVSRLIWHVSVGAAVVTGVVCWFVLAKLLEALGADVLTAAGAGLAAQWQRERAALAGAGSGRLDPASLERHAFAVAAGAVATSGTPAGGPPRRAARAARAAAGPPPETRERPAEIWSSFSGTWRRVVPESSEGLGSGGPEPGMMFSFAFVTLGLIVLAVLMTMNTVFLVPVTLAVVAVEVTLIGLGMGTVRRRSAMPKSATFDGQVVARWQQRSEDSEGGNGIVRRTAIDDGARAWIFCEPHVYARTAVGDLVQVTFSPRTGQLQRLAVTAARPRTEHGSGPR